MIAASAGLLALSPLTAHFVKQVTSSGSTLVDWVVQQNFYSVQNNSVLSFHYGCNRQVLTKQSSVSIRALTTTLLFVLEVGWLAWSPVFDNTTWNWMTLIIFICHLTGVTRITLNSRPVACCSVRHQMGSGVSCLPHVGEHVSTAINS